MKNKHAEKIEIPSGVECTYDGGVLTCRKDSVEIKRKLEYPSISFNVSGNHLEIKCEKGNKSHSNMVSTFAAHVRNVFDGMDKKYIYELETCNVHFPITLKVHGDTLAISNFLGEKTPRKAKILPNVHVELKGQHITISSNNKDSAGQTAANFEKAAKVIGRDRRIYQDGIYIVSKPGRRT